MWPKQEGRVFYAVPKPDCRDGGPHRWMLPQFLQADRSISMRACRYCLSEVVKQFKVVDGKLIVTVLTPTDKP